MKKFVLLLTILLCSVAVAFAASVSDQEAKALFDEKCDFCHSKETPESQRLSRDDWKDLVYRMKDDNGCDITVDQAEIIIDYLSRTYPAK